MTRDQGRFSVPNRNLEVRNWTCEIRVIGGSEKDLNVDRERT